MRTVNRPAVPSRGSLASLLLVLALSWYAPLTLEVAQSTTADPPIVSGTGFLVSPKGYFLTAAHVVGDVADLTVCPAMPAENLACLAAEVVARDPAHDLALLKVKDGDTLRQIAPLQIGNASRVRRQDAVWVMGFPFADQTGGSLTTTSGHITAIQPGTEGHRFQLDAAVNPGNSGGPLLNDRGEVIGVITSKLLVRGAGFTVSEGLNYAVPISFALSLLAHIPDFDFSALGQTKQRLSPQEVDKTDAPGVVRILGRQIRTQVDEILDAEDAATGITGKDGAPMVLVPAGEFIMGSNDGYSDEKPVHRVWLDAYYIDHTEVTVAHYGRFLAATGHKPTDDWEIFSLFIKTFKSRAENWPVTVVTWYDADAYCRYYGKRLPTEAEWEKAARGTDGRRYPWGNERDHRFANSASFWARRTVDFRSPEELVAFWNTGEGARIKKDRLAKGEDMVFPVGSFPTDRSPYGLFDMAGNVMEWTADWYKEDYYKWSPSRNPTGPSSGESRVLRGGSWLEIALALRTSNRLPLKPTFEQGFVGFRCAQDAR